MAEPTPPPPTDADPEAALPRMTLGEHLDELRRRVGRSVLAVVAATIAAFCFNDALWSQAVAPYNEAIGAAGLGADGTSRLSTISPLDGFIQPFKLAFIVAIVVSSPYVLWQMWGFIAAGLYAHEKKAVRVFFPASLVLFAAGVATAFLVVLPVGLRFLIGFARSHGMASNFAVGEYLSLGLSLLFGLGIAYQLPIVMVFLQAMGIVERETLRKGWRVAVLTAFVLAMVLTPDPSPVSQTIMAGPLVGLYFLGVWAGRFVGERRERFTVLRAWPLLVAVLALVALFVYRRDLRDLVPSGAPPP
ncbi:MAG: twin-arginine translocase subunit TatC, partial [Planctomycetia bacterium]|nr:twin-arginine translocase subunit TatC [Planctomycetia bacterium]